MPFPLSNILTPTLDALKVKLSDSLPAGSNIIGQVKLTDGTDALLINANGSINIVPINSAGVELFTATNPGHVQLTGSNIQDAQALPMTQAQKDIVADVYDNIFDLCDGEAIIFPMWESSGDIKSITNKNIALEVDGVTYGQPGLLHKIMRFDGVNDSLREKPSDCNRTYNTEEGLTLTTTKLAQLIKPQAVTISFVTLFLKRVGTLSSAKLRIDIVEDNSGQPGTIIGTSEEQHASLIQTSGGRFGFAFSSPVSLDYDKNYWIVLYYSVSTGVNESNYIAWLSDSNCTYGYNMAAYTTAWTQYTKSLAFELYNSDLRIENDLTVIVVTKNAASISPIWRCVVSLSRLNIYNLIPAGGIYLTCTTTSDYILLTFKQPYYLSNEYHVLAASFSKSKSTGKVNLYVDGINVASGNGTAGAGLLLRTFPLAVGATYRTNNPNGVDFANSYIGNLIICRSELSSSVIRKITTQLYRLYLNQGV